MYDKVDREQANKDLNECIEDISRNPYDEEMIRDGICPDCAGTSYMDGDYENEDDSCDGVGVYGCDQGSLLFRDEQPLWVEIKKYDDRQAARLKSESEFDHDAAVRLAAKMMKNMSDPRQIVFQLDDLYPHLGRAQRSAIAAEASQLAFG